MYWKSIAKLCVLLMLPVLQGAQCSFVASSGGEREEDDPPPNLVVIIREGRLGVQPVEGLRYVSGDTSGFTGADGAFRYEAGNRVRFFIGDLPLGEAVNPAPVMLLWDLVPDGAPETPAVVNIARLLQSLDADTDAARITIARRLHGLARRENVELAAALQSLDYSDDDMFANSASQLVATLTADYPFTGVLVDAAAARRHLNASRARLDGAGDGVSTVPVR